MGDSREGSLAATADGFAKRDFGPQVEDEAGVDAGALTGADAGADVEQDIDVDLSDLDDGDDGEDFGSFLDFLAQRAQAGAAGAGDGAATGDGAAADGAPARGKDPVRLASVVHALAAIKVGPMASQAASSELERHKEIVAGVVAAGDVSGDCAEWHNLVASLMGRGEHALALEVLRCARRRFPNDATLLGDAIWCAGYLGDWSLGDALLGEARDPARRVNEDWSLAVYVCDYLCERAEALDGKASFDEAIEFVQGAIHRLGPADRLYCAQATALIKAGRKRDAKELLESVLLRKEVESDGTTKKGLFPAPQCCGKYLKEIMGESIDYERVIQIADEGIRFSNTMDDTITLAYFVLRKALAMDGIINSTSHAPTQSLGNPEYVRQTLSTYALAYALDEDYRERCRERFTLLAALGGVSDLKVDMYVSAFDHSAD